MKRLKITLTFILFLQVFIAPVVRTCLELQHMTTQDCCFPDECKCEVSQITVNSYEDHALLDIPLSSVSLVKFLTVTFDFNLEIESDLSTIAIDRPPPLKRYNDTHSLYQVYII